MLSDDPSYHWESEDCRWERHKSTIIRLYMHKGYTLNKVMEFMESKLNFRATPKTYKSRLRRWGCRKNIVLPTDLESIIIKELMTADPLESNTASKLLILPSGQTVDPNRLAKYLNRKWTTNRRNNANYSPPLTAIRTPDVFYVPEALYNNTRGYILGRFDEMNAPDNSETKRGSNPHTLRWLAFAYGVHVAVADERYDDAILHLRKAPVELMNLLLHQPGLVLTNLFRFITSIICYLPLEDAGAQQFLKVIKSLLRYGATCLPKTSESAAGGYSSSHPIRLVLENLAKVEDEQLLMVSRRAWMVACLAAFDLMSELARANANTRWMNLAKMGGASQLPPDQGAVSDRSVKSHTRLATLINRAFFLQTLAEATGRVCSLEDSVLEALKESKEATCNLDDNTRLALHQFFGIPMDNTPSSRLTDFLAASPE